jgi:hypothetical protein
MFEFVRDNPGVTRLDIKRELGKAGYHVASVQAGISDFVQNGVWTENPEDRTLRLAEGITEYVVLGDNSHPNKRGGRAVTTLDEAFPKPDTPAKNLPARVQRVTAVRRQGIDEPHHRGQNWPTHTVLVALQAMTPEEIVDSLTIRQAREVHKVIERELKRL